MYSVGNLSFGQALAQIRGVVLVRDSSLAMRQLGKARTFGLYTFGLYNETNSYYASTWTTLLRPTDLKWAGSSKYLLMRAKEKEVYMTRDWAKFIEKHGDQKPILGPPVIKVTAPPNKWGEKPIISSVCRVLAWEKNNQRYFGNCRWLQTV